ncbi:hypothetical protein MRX96_046531 [Rhipicephalus microplus]
MSALGSHEKRVYFCEVSAITPAATASCILIPLEFPIFRPGSPSAWLLKIESAFCLRNITSPQESLEATSLGVKVQKQTKDQERAEIDLEGKDAQSDNEAARRTEDARQGCTATESSHSILDCPKDESQSPQAVVGPSESTRVSSLYGTAVDALFHPKASVKTAAPDISWPDEWECSTHTAYSQHAQSRPVF